VSHALVEITRPVWGALLTNGLCRRDERRARAAHPHISSPTGNTPAGAAESRQSQEPRIMGIFRGFDGAC
jgi:hypothetical protein